jgi:8-oxo-dGTP pyrophosphatase MutT (NUDIX family)
VQRPADTPSGHYAFIGGEHDLGDSLVDRIRREFEEETTARVVSAEYRFVVENRFLWRDELIQTLEHYFEVSLDRVEVQSKEPHLEQIWLSPEAFAQSDVRPTVVRNALTSGEWRYTRHFTVGLLQ